MRFWSLLFLALGFMLVPALVLPGITADLGRAHAASKTPEYSGGGGAMVEKGEGIVTIPSSHSVEETVDKLKGILQSKGVNIFAVVDHSGEAEKVGLKMPDTKLVIFGSPKAGTPLMLAAPSIAIDLPLKILVSQDANGKVWVSYNSPEYLKARHGLPQELVQNIAVVGALASKAAE